MVGENLEFCISRMPRKALNSSILLKVASMEAGSFTLKKLSLGSYFFPSRGGGTFHQIITLPDYYC